MSEGLIYKQLPKVMADIKPISKDKVNQAQRFKFRGIDDVYNHVQPILAKHGVFTTAEIIGRSREIVTSKSGTKMVFCVNQFKFKFYAEDGSFVEAYADGEAMDSGDKASNKCAAIAHKYALLQTLCIPTEDLTDPDSQSPNINMTQAPVQKKTVSEKQISRLHAIRSKAGMKDTECMRLATQLFGISDLSSLDQQQYQKLCEAIESTPNRNQQSASTINSRWTK